MAINDYIEAWKKGTREAHLLHIQDKDPYLPVLAEIVPEMNQRPQANLGLCQIPMELVEGTATRGRTTAFSRSFYPLLEPESEFAMKWADLYDGILEDGLRQPIKALEYYNHFYVVEGNKRVSVMRQLGSLNIEAEVTRVLPEKEDSQRYRVYCEFLSFFKDTRIDYILFSHEGYYARLRNEVGMKEGEKWPEDMISDIRSCFYRFQQAYLKAEGNRRLSASDAFLLYLEIFSYAEACKRTPSQIIQDIAKIRSEYNVAEAGKPAALLSQPSEEKPSLIQSVLHRPPRTLKCAFLYNSSPERSGWTYWHELARKATENTFESQVETVAKPDVTMDEATEAIESLINEGYTTIFAASPVFLDACIHESALHPEARILNCSLLASYHNVRSYYLRIYEAKFILGAIAGAMADNNKIGYIADYPIYGVPASINAFAIGAQMTNPRAKVYLDWSTLPGHNPEEALTAQDVRIISSRDISAPLLEYRTFGLYEKVPGDKARNLAMPAWNWSKLYEGIVRSILSGAWSEEGEQHADRAMAYYMGMATGAIDLFCSSRVPARLKRLVDLLHERIRSEAFLPFVGPQYDQNGTLRIDQDEALTPQDIILMDYLADNVIGTIPKVDQLNPAATNLVTLQGIRAATESSDPSSEGTENNE
ncbi:MAG: BMP family ABC transporter substrate-binding protein [Clostridia bacterium]|nr:BMP family ABC transporter substrate-binding protein [Clostridia bacterium]